MNKALISTVMMCFCLMGCIDLNIKNWNKDASSDKQEELTMLNSTHLKFKGVPIDGTLKEFVSRMKHKGFERIGKQDDTEILEGDFAGFKNCTVYVYTLDNKDLVSQISVVFQKQEKWEYLYNDYNYLKELLTEKYGEPSECIETVDYYYELYDKDMIYAFENNDAKYETSFKTDNGDITLRIEPYKFHSCFVVLSYQDRENGEIIREHAKNDL